MTVTIVAWVLLLSIAAYACGGGTDYGAGFWDLLAGGAERGQRPRWLIDHAMAPVWEVNNVWLVFVLVVMWTGFPTVFQAVFSALWLPLALAAVGLVLRGAGFALRKPTRRLSGRRLYGAAFAVSSLLTPYFLGTAVGGVVSGRVTAGAAYSSAEVWSNPTSIMTGLLAVAASAFLGAVFLTGDAYRLGVHDLVPYFRLRALCSLAVLGVLALVGLFVTRDDARYVHDGLTRGPGLVLVALSALGGLATAWLLVRGSRLWARGTAVTAVVLVVVAWGIAQRPYMLPTSLTVTDAAGASATLNWLVIVSVVALALVGPAVVLLYRLDARGELEPLTDEDTALQETGPLGRG
ncbi:cytochrome d ubiquinol oxidase subunit II [Streptomyces sp. MUM 203J]|uniref:cytochrome d ubiquinol oxidase subunit II n=1 Tax=Streptomyces sp. MUM 203J TaxID=2791990 RepID=UPI001F038A0D|nr:cytochrome d ubiquinol oxidase subunit II [Streptomyces sp. MUM 203J]MCH0540359.1 cytochrome d ubiquinol oxidase subunit II [Streptomyces sp. MUM 203J]